MFIKSPFLLLILMILISGCVGTIEDSNPEVTKSGGASDGVLLFEGIDSATAISHDKIDVFFYPSANGDPEDITYLISYDGLDVPFSIPAILMIPDYRGLLRYTVPSLSPDSVYSLEVQVLEIATGIKSSVPKTVTGKTFSNLTSDFLGIQKAQLAPGVDGMNAIKVEWSLATKFGIIGAADPRDVNQYIVTVIDSNFLTPGDMNNSSFSEPKRKIFYVNKSQKEITIYGLNSGTSYFVQVRSQHKGYVDNSFNPDYKVEENIKYLPIETLSADSSAINLDANALQLNLSAGVQGENSFSALWAHALGIFDHYRFYYAKLDSVNGSLGLAAISVNPICQTIGEVICKKVNVDFNQASAFGLTKNTTYEARILACIDFDCNQYVETGTSAITTSPPVAFFPGPLAILASGDINSLGSLDIVVGLPDFSSGVLNGYIVKYTEQGGDTDLVFIINDDLISNNSGLTIEPFDFETDFKITVSGIDPYSNEKHCFMVYPFTYDENGVKVHHIPGSKQEYQKCIVPSGNYVIAPDRDAFPGTMTCIASTATKSIYTSWFAPAAGVFTDYELFWVKTGAVAAFDFSDAIYDKEMGIGIYKSKMISSDYVDPLTSSVNTTVAGLTTGESYYFGVLTYFSGADGIIYRSEYNVGNCIVAL